MVTLTYLSDQHFHDPLVKLWERPPWVIHFREPGQLCAELDQPETSNSTSSAASPQILWALSRAERPSLAGNIQHLNISWVGKEKNLQFVCAYVVVGKNTRDWHSTHFLLWLFIILLNFYCMNGFYLGLVFLRACLIRSQILYGGCNYLLWLMFYMIQISRKKRKEKINRIAALDN